jgi:WD40 repeat protein
VIKGLGWSEEEQLLVVLADGTVRCYDLQGDFTQFSLGHDSENQGVHSCRLVPDLASSPPHPFLSLRARIC